MFMDLAQEPTFHQPIDFPEIAGDWDPSQTATEIGGRLNSCEVAS